MGGSKCKGLLFTVHGKRDRVSVPPCDAGIKSKAERERERARDREIDREKNGKKDATSTIYEG